MADKKKLKKMASKSPKKDGWIDASSLFKKAASEGHNPFKLVTHVGKKKAK